MPRGANELEMTAPGRKRAETGVTPAFPRIKRLATSPHLRCLDPMRTYPSLFRFLGAAVAGTFLLAGCKQKTAQAEKTADGLTKIKVGYIGLTCEAPLYMALEKG